MYDVFISYSSSDKPFVKRLASDLEKNGIRVWFDDWQMKPGDSLLGKISDAIERSSYLFVILSPTSVSSKWVKQEVRQAMAEEIYAEKVKVVPIVYQECQIPNFLKDKVYVNVSQKVLDSYEYEYELQRLVDLVFDNPMPDRPQLGEHLIEEYETLLHSKQPDPRQFGVVAHNLVSVLKNIFFSPLEKETTYFKQKQKLGEINLAINDLPNALEAYECAYQYAQDHEDMRLMIQSGIPMACVLSFMRRTEEAIESFRSVLGKVADDLSEGKAINLPAFLEYTIQVCFYEHCGMVNPLVLVFQEDYHRLNLRIQQAVDALYASVRELMGADFEANEGTFTLAYADLLNNFGVLRPALKYYSVAQKKGIAEAKEKAERIQNSQEMALWMSEYLLGYTTPPSEPVPEIGLTIHSPEAFKRILMSSGSSVAAEQLKGIFPDAGIDNLDATEPALWTNGVTPIRIMIYEDFPKSSVGICDALKRMRTGVIVAAQDEDAKEALQEFSTIELYVADHHDEFEGVFEPINGLEFQRHFVKNNHPHVISALVCRDEELAQGFMNVGGDYVIDSRNKTEQELAQALINILNRRRKSHREGV